MIIIFSYLVTIFFTLLFCSLARRTTKPYPKLNLGRSGIYFYSQNRHKIRIDNAKVMQLDHSVYIKKNEKTIIINNVDRVYVIKDYLYFTALGNCQIVFNAKSFYRYFNISISSNKFDMEALKNEALQDIIEHIFNLKDCEKLKRFLNICNNILKIQLKNDKLIVKRNKFNLKFTLTYKLRDKLKMVNVY